MHCAPGVDLKNIEVWFQDEARIGQQGTITRLWAKRGTRPRVIRQLQYEFTYIFGAACPEKDTAVGLIIGEVGIDAMIAHLKQISVQVPPGNIAVVVLDRASWHKSKKINCFENVRLLPLPPVSPELNPAEQIWEYLRAKYLANRTFKNQADIIDACCDAWNAFSKTPNIISSLCSRSWAKMMN